MKMEPGRGRRLHHSRAPSRDTPAEDGWGLQRGKGGSTGERVVGGRDHLHPFDKLRAGSNLPPSRGKGFVGAERVNFIVMEWHF